jgi:hypothetical protein
VITTAMNGWERNYKVIVLADTGTAIPLYQSNGSSHTNTAAERR